MPANTKLEDGVRKDQLWIIADVSSVVFAPFFAPKGVLSKIPRDILKLTFFIAKDVVFVPENVGQWQ